MDELKRTNNLINFYRKMFWILWVVSIIGFIILGSIASYYKVAYEESIDVITEEFVTFSELFAACLELSNVTSEEVVLQAAEMFIFDDRSGQ